MNFPEQRRLVDRADRRLDRWHWRHHRRFLGGLIGTLGGLGKARRFVLTLTAVLMGLGVVGSHHRTDRRGARPAICSVLFRSCCLGSFSRESAVETPLVLRRRYEQIELRKMAAMDSR